MTFLSLPQGRSSVSSLSIDATGSPADKDKKKDDFGLVECPDPEDLLAELSYDFDNPKLSGELIVERSGSDPEYKVKGNVGVFC